MVKELVDTLNQVAESSATELGLILTPQALDTPLEVTESFQEVHTPQQLDHKQSKIHKQEGSSVVIHKLSKLLANRVNHRPSKIHKLVDSSAEILKLYPALKIMDFKIRLKHKPKLKLKEISSKILKLAVLLAETLK